MKQRIRVWLLILTILLVTVAAAMPLGIHFMAHIAPKAVLSYALNNAFSQLEMRVEGNPLLLASRLLPWDGIYRAEIDAIISNDQAGDICLDSVICADMNVNRILAENRIRSSQRNMDVNVYLDSEYMALSSETLAEGKCYGITYDTFSEDIRSFPLLEYLVPEQMLKNWEKEIGSIHDMLNQNYTIPSVPQLSVNEIRALLFGVVALPCDTEKTELVINDETISCIKLSYVADEITVTAIPFMGDIACDFYLCGKRLVKLDVFMDTDREDTMISFTFGEDYLTAPVLIQFSQIENGEKQKYIASVTTTKTDALYAEDWTVHQEQGREAASVSFSYCYDINTGEMELSVGQKKAKTFILQADEDKIILETEDFVGLIQILTGKSQETDRTEVYCSMILSEGSIVTPPPFKNLDKWSLADLTEILKGYMGWMS